MKRLTILLPLLLASFGITSAQGLEKYESLIDLDDELSIKRSNMDEMKSNDVHDLWIKDHPRQRFGFIGSNYRKLDVKYLSIIKNTEIPNQYFVYGKSRVADNICAFQGIIEIEESNYASSLEYFAGQHSGIIGGKFTYYETPNCGHSGIFSGSFVTYWTKNKQGEFELLDLPSIEGNNQFSGTWTEYGQSNSLTINWGYSRIPNSGDLDVGTSEFGPNEKYYKFGWDSFMKAHGGGFNEATTDKAQNEELAKWWKD